MKKILSILVVPLVAVLMLVGCGTTKRNTLDITTLIQTNREAYAQAQIYGASTYNNWFFEDAEDNSSALMLRVIYDNEVQLNDFVHGLGLTYSDERANLEYKYTQLRTVYDRVIKMTYSYYNTYADSFYASAETKGVSSKELTNLYNKAKTLFKEIEAFNSSKVDLEREVKLYGNSSQILLASLDKFNYAYNGLVRKSLDFVEYFKELHYNYFFKGVNIYDAAYATQMYLDAQVTLAEFIYNDYLKPLTKNSVVSLIDLKVDSGRSGDYINIFENSTFTQIVKDVQSPITFNETNKAYNSIALASIAKLTNAFTTEGATDAAVAQIRQFETSLNNFKQYYELYLKSFNNINVQKYYDYRYSRNGVTGTYVDSLSKTNAADLVEKANVTVVQNFEKDKVVLLLNAMLDLVNFNN